MRTRSSYWKFFLRGLALIAGIALSTTAHSQTSPQAFSLQGRLVDNSNQPVQASSVSFTIQIRSPGVEDCLLYEETHTVNMSNSDGLFSIPLGTGTRGGTAAFKDTSTLAQAFTNSSSTISSLTCASGSTYAPASGQRRKLRLHFDDGTGYQTLSQDMQINSVPYALYADTLQGRSASDFLQTISALESLGAGTTQSRINDIANTRYSVLDQLLAGTSALYVRPGAAANFTSSVSFTQAPTYGGAITAGTQLVTKNYCDANIAGFAADASVTSLAAGDAGKTLSWDGSKWVAQIPSTTDATKLPLAGGTMSGAINMGAQNITGAGAVSGNTSTFKSSSIVDNINSTVNLLVNNQSTGNIALSEVAVRNDGTARMSMFSYGSGSNQFVGSQTAANAVALVNSGVTSKMIVGTTNATDLHLISGDDVAVTIKPNLHVGVGTTTPSSKFHINNGALLVDGLNGSTPVSGGGDRMMYVPDKGAFRAGRANTTEWDEANIGKYSVAFGEGNRASAWYSVAAGDSNSVTNQSASAFGEYNTVSGWAATSLGSNNTVSGRQSLTTGYSNTASGWNAIVAGSSNTASGDSSLVNGMSSTASGYMSNALGNGLNSPGLLQTSFGRFNHVSGTEDPTSWVATDPLFVIGNGSGAGARANALTILKNGNVGVGTASPGISLDLGSRTDAVRLPAGNSTTDRPTTPANGMIRYNTTDNRFEAYENGAWVNMIGGGGGGSGTVTSITAGTGLDGGTITTSGTIAIANSGVGTNQIANAAITTPKLFANPGINRLVATDGSTGATLAPLTCSSGEILVWNIALGWQCTAASAADTTKLPLAGGTMSGAINMGSQNISNANNIAASLFLTASGSAAAPSYSFSGNATTGLFSPAANTLGFSTNGSEAVRIDSSGNVGIGTSTLTEKLNVVGNFSVANAPGGRTYRFRTSGAMLDFEGSTSTMVYSMWSGANFTGTQQNYLAFDSSIQRARTYGDWFFNTGNGIGGGSLVFKVDSATGFVGYGTTSPSSLIDLNGAFTQRGMATPSVSSSGQGRIYFDSTANKFRVSENGGAYTDLVGAGTDNTKLPLAGGTMSGAINMGSQNITNAATIGATTFSASAGSAATPSVAVGDSTAGVFSPSTNTVGFSTSGNEQMRITSSGLVGIGTSNPTGHLNIASTEATTYSSPGSTAFPGGTELRLTNSSAADSRGGFLTFLVNNFNTNSQGAYIGAISTTGAGVRTPTIVFGQQTAANVYTERMRIDSGGRVGIGTTSPQSQSLLDVSSSTNFTYSQITNLNNSTGWHAAAQGLVTYYGGSAASDASSQIYLKTLRGGPGTETAIQNNDFLGSLNFQGGFSPSVPTVSAARISGRASSNFTSTTGSGSLLFETRSTSDSDVQTRMVISSTGSVGIGTSTPATLLDLNGAFTQRGMATPSVSSSGQGRIYFDSTANKFRVSENGGAYTDLVGSGSGTVSGTTDRIAKFTSSSAVGDSIIYESSGNIGIGKAPSTAFDVGLGGTSYMTASSGGVSIGSASLFSNARLTVTSTDINTYSSSSSSTWQPSSSTNGAAISNNSPTDNSASYLILVPRNSNNNAQLAYIGAVSNTGAGSFSPTIVFGRRTGSTAYSELMRIDTDGDLGINTTSPSERLHVVGNLRVQGSTDCTLGNGAGGTNCSSDVRLKRDIASITNPLDRILAIHGVDFVWNDKSPSPGRKDIGVIAQDVERVFPTAVVQDKDSGYKRVDYAVLVAPIIEAIRELFRKVTGQDQKLAELEARLAKAESENAALKTYLCRQDASAPFCKQE